MDGVGSLPLPKLQQHQRLLLLSDLATPSCVVDLQALQRTLDTASYPESKMKKSAASIKIPPLFLSQSNRTLYPSFIESPSTFQQKIDFELQTNTAHSVDLDRAAARPGICYLHSRVVRSREQPPPPPDSFLAKLDLPPGLAAHLVLGLNNHHVISYYWARSAGAGAAMEAPGVVLDDQACLWWSTTGTRPSSTTITGSRSMRSTLIPTPGLTSSSSSSSTTNGRPETLPSSLETLNNHNSNDGKRSEWVNFLRPHDQVQLVPEDAVRAWQQLGVAAADGGHGPRSHVFGVSSRGRPLGSEPMVVCAWS
jgi:hypothetical protein